MDEKKCNGKCVTTTEVNEEGRRKMIAQGSDGRYKDHEVHLMCKGCLQNILDVIKKVEEEGIK